MTQPAGFQRERKLYCIYLESLEKFSTISVKIQAALAPAVATLRSMLQSGMPKNRDDLNTLANLLPTFSTTGCQATPEEEAEIKRIHDLYQDKFNAAVAPQRSFPRSLGGRGALGGSPAAK